MNYRHAFHAGNFADVLKHVVLIHCIGHLRKKPTPFRIVDTHAGAGRYALTNHAGHRRPEWQDGIGRLWPWRASEPCPPPLQAYLDIIVAENRGHAGLAYYPGSPLIAAGLLRSDDILIANEREPEPRAALAASLGVAGSSARRQIKVLGIDGYTALKSLLPPPERRGVVLIDPPFEEPGELVRMTQGLDAALDRFAGGIYLLWFPIKDPKPIERFYRGVGDVVAARGIAPPAVVELFLRTPRNPSLLNGMGLVVVNPPYTLRDELAPVMTLLAKRFSAEVGSIGRIVHIGESNNRVSRQDH